VSNKVLRVPSICHMGVPSVSTAGCHWPGSSCCLPKARPMKRFETMASRTMVYTESPRKIWFASVERGQQVLSENNRNAEYNGFSNSLKPAGKALYFVSARHPSKASGLHDHSLHCAVVMADTSNTTNPTSSVYSVMPARCPGTTNVWAVSASGYKSIMDVFSRAVRSGDSSQ
jgi:hypothetical protein